MTLPATVNDVPLQESGEALAPAELRQRACTELLRQAAIACGLLAADDPLPRQGATTQAASTAIEALLAREVAAPEPDEAACRRHFDAQPARFRRGDRAHVRHILFAVTPGVDVRRLRERAERTLVDVRCRRDGAADAFPVTAAALSNCPSGAAGGDLGWLQRDDCAPEFARELFAGSEIGVLPRLVHTRFGLHIVEVLAREAGATPAFDAVRGAVASALHRQHFTHALRHYLQRLAGAARVQGVDLEGTDAPLVQ